MTRNVVKLMDAAGYDLILIETVGVGQTEIDIMDVADTVTVVVVPEGGDGIQAMKAGLLEIADILVVNKSDRDGAARIGNALKDMLRMGEKAIQWLPPVVYTQANKDVGVDVLYDAIVRHRKVMQKSSTLIDRRKARDTREFFLSIEERIGHRLRELVQQDGRLRVALENVVAGLEDPSCAGARLVGKDSLLHQ